MRVFESVLVLSCTQEMIDSFRAEFICFQKDEERWPMNELMRTNFNSSQKSIGFENGDLVTKEIEFKQI